MKTVMNLVRRNRKLFFRDRGMVMSAMITPFILIVLYGTFLANVYKDSLVSDIPDFMDISEKLVNGTVAGQLAAALLAVSCVTVTFCVNLTMIQDKANGTIKDFSVSPVKKPLVYIAYFLSTTYNSLIINGVALLLCLGYIGTMGWYLNAADILFIVADLILLVLFGSILSSIVCYPLTTQGQMSAVGTIVSAGYGFVCGAYMPISNFGEGLQKALSYMPSTYGTSMVKNHFLRGVFEEMEKQGFPKDIVTSIQNALDCNPEFMGNVVKTNEMMCIIAGTIIVLVFIYLLITMVSKKG